MITKNQIYALGTCFCVSVLLTACGGGGSNTGDNTTRNDEGSGNQNNDSPSNGNAENNRTLEERIATGNNASDTVNHWACVYPNAGNTTTAFFFWRDGNGQNVDGNESTDFTWIADEANNAINATVPGLGAGGLNSILFQTETQFTAFDTFSDEVISCTFEPTQGGQNNGNLTLEQKLFNGQSESEQTTFWDCGTTDYAFFEDGRALLLDETGRTGLDWDLSDADSIIATGFGGFVLQNIAFADDETFSARDFTSGDLRICSKTAVNNDIERLITGKSESDIGSESWACEIESISAEFSLLFYADGTAQSVVFDRDQLEVDGDDFDWSINADTGNLVVDGDELLNFSFNGDRAFSANTENGGLFCSRSDQLPLLPILATGQTIDTNNTLEWACDIGVSFQLGLDGRARIDEGNESTNATWQVVIEGLDAEIVFTDLAVTEQEEITDLRFNSINTISGIVDGNEPINCTRS